MRFWSRWLVWLDSSDAIVAHWLRAAREALLGEMPILAGGTALFTIFAIVPTIAATVAIYSAFADPAEINSHISALDSVLPPNVVAFITDQLERQTQRSNRDLGFAVVVSIIAAVFSARGAARAMIDSLNRVYRVRERRGTLHKLLATFVMATSTLVGLIVMLMFIVALPALVSAAGYDENWGVVRWARWPILMLMTFTALTLLYRFAPSPRPLADMRRFLWPGAAISTVLLVAMSLLLTVWVDRVADYNAWYGTFGSVVIVMLWCYLSTIAVLLGGFVNAELERHSGAPEPDRSMY